VSRVGRRKARTGPRTSGFWRSTLLNTGAALGGVCLVAAALCAVLGVTPIAFRSDSMAPAISSGDLALAKSVSAGDIGEGDIVSVTDRQGQRVTHRVVEFHPYGSSIRLTLKADDSAVPDAETYDVTKADRVFISIPWLGYVFGPARGLVAIAIGGVFVACLAVVLFVPRRRIHGTRRTDT
jgi:signal peptidase